MVFVSKCVCQSRVFIKRILRLLWSVKFNHHHVNLNLEFRKDIQWWRRFLHCSSPRPGEVFTTDACLMACGGLCEHGYFHAEFPEFLSVQQLDINSLELLTIVVALKLWGHLWRGLHLTARCDNAVAVTALNSGRCQNAFLILVCVKCFLAATHKFES